MKINTALILCAGYGKRLYPLTKKLPKPLLKINNNTLLEKTFILIKSLKIKKIKINTFYLKDKIKNFIENLNHNFEIEIVDDGLEILNTGGGIKNMVENSPEHNFIIFNPDTIWELNYIKYIEKMEKYYFDKKLNNILLMVNKKNSYDKRLKGDFNMKNNLLSKSSKNEFIFTGCQIINKKIFLDQNKKKFPIMENWENLISKKNLNGFESKNNFFHITDLKIFEKILKNK